MLLTSFMLTRTDTQALQIRLHMQYVCKSKGRGGMATKGSYDKDVVTGRGVSTFVPAYSSNLRLELLHD